MKTKKVKPIKISVSSKDQEIDTIVSWLELHKKAFSNWSMWNGRVTMWSNPAEEDYSRDIFVKIMGLSKTYKLG